MRATEAIARAAGTRPVLIAGPTASGKSGLALSIARAHGGRIVNADALQVYGNWRILTARPGPADLARAPHHLYGHVPGHDAYSVGRWLREVAPLLSGPRPIIVGGTGLYFTALTRGLAEIPPTPPEIRTEADLRRAREGHAVMGDELDRSTADRIDLANPARVQRAWEVWRATGRGLADWQDDTPPPLMPPGSAVPLVVEAPTEWLNPRIEGRFDAMLAAGALDEAAKNFATFDPNRPADRAIGAAELVAHLRGEIDLATARESAIIATRQYAKRQRTWFRSRMEDWPRVTL